MKIRKLIMLTTLAVGALFAPSARAEVSGGDIWSVDLVTDYNGTIPSKVSPLLIGEYVTVRVRLVNRDYEDASITEYKPWYFRTTTMMDSNPEASFFAPQLGLKFGNRDIFADYVGSAEVKVDDVVKFTDLFFRYQVKSGDLALPAVFMTSDAVSPGNRAGDDDATDYALKNCNYAGTYWQLTNKNGDDCVFHFCDVNKIPSPDKQAKAGEQHRYISGLGLNLFAQTIDFDNKYAVEPASIGEDGTWRQIYRGLTSTTTTLPTIAVDGEAENSATMYVWIEDPTVASFLVTDDWETVTDRVGGADVTRTVLKVPVPMSSSAVTFRVKGLQNGSTKIRMSSTRNLTVNKAGSLVEDWVERPITVVDPPAPYVALELQDVKGDPLSKPVVCSVDYQDYAAVMKVILSQPAEEETTVTFNTTIKVPTEADPTKYETVDYDVFSNNILGISSTTDGTPWINQISSVKFNVGESEKTLFIYGLGSIKSISDFGITFTPHTTAEQFASDDQSHICNLVVKDIAPVVNNPVAGEEINDVIAGEDYLLDVNVFDTFRDLRIQGWKILVKSGAFGDSKWHTYEDGLVFDGDTGDLMEPLPLKFTVEGTHDVQFYVKDPNGTSSTVIKFKVVVAAAKKAWAEFDRNGTSYAEGETAKVYFHISQPSESASALYAFLRPLNEDSRDKVLSTALTDPMTNNGGVYIAPGDTDSQDRYAEVAILDGKLNASYEVVICTKSSYSSAYEASYIPGQCTLIATNVTPVIRKVSMGGIDIKTNGSVLAKPIPQNVTKRFSVDIYEPGSIDKSATDDDAFLTQWRFGDGEWIDVTGNPNLASAAVEHVFTSPGDQTITVRCQDKDMRALGEWSQEFSFTVTVLTMPAVTITPQYGTNTYYEDQTGSAESLFNISLTAPAEFANATDRLRLELSVATLGDDTLYSAADCELSRTTVEFRSGDTTPQSFYLKQLDGTLESASSGFRITATVLNPELDIEGKTWDDGTIDVFVLNRAPTIMTPAVRVDTEDKPISTVAQINTEYTLSWSIKDVKPDKASMSVIWETSEGQRVVYKQGEGYDDVMTGVHTFSFTSSGEKTITMIAQDKDGELDTRTFYYVVDPSKSAVVSAHSPGAQVASPNGQSARYATAAGLGAGRVDGTDKNPTIVNNFFSTFTVGINESDVGVVATGYSVEDPVNTTIDVNGNSNKTGADYDYTNQRGSGADGYDSFFYAWLCNNPKVQNDLYPSDTVYAPGKSASYAIPLPLPEENKLAYDTQRWEALFSREMLPSDNCGDINQDFIPDVYTLNYDFGLFNLVTHERVGDDLTKADRNAIRDFNGDNDYLPTTAVIANGLIPSLTNSWIKSANAFTARLEIRGFGDGLNDAPVLAGISGVNPDKVYTNPAEDPNSTLSDVEWWAWNSLGQPDDWSPERPTDPTLADTDGDGLPDGYEYYFWYKAHVGFADKDAPGGFRRLTGNRYNIHRPEGVDIITSEEIERIYDPRHDLAAGDKIDWNTQDTDNDGLPDILELALGTNPLEWDTDGDGLCDYWEVIYGGKICDPLKAATNGQTADGALNPDGDFMARLEEKDLAGLAHFGIPMTMIVSVETTTGYPLYFATRKAAEDITLKTDNTDTGTLLVSRGKKYVYIGGNLTEGVDYRTAPDGTIHIIKTIELDNLFAINDDNIRQANTRLLRGEPLDEPPTADYEYNYQTIEGGLLGPAACEWEERSYKAWKYGKGDTYCLGLDTTVPETQIVISIGTHDFEIMHWMVYQYRTFTKSPLEMGTGFSPTTAWSIRNGFVHERWRPDNIDGADPSIDATLTMATAAQVGVPMDTSSYTVLDEYLVKNFMENCGGAKIDDALNKRASMYASFTTRPLDVTNPASNEEGGENDATAVTGAADSDGDGVPDGWELYVMGGPAKNAYNLAHKIFGANSSGGDMSPWSARAGSPSTANTDYAILYPQHIAPDAEFNPVGDQMTELAEFTGVDSVAVYAGCSTIKWENAYDTKWLNKFWPTDPWSTDTDCDGVCDRSEGLALNGTAEASGSQTIATYGMIYGDPADNGRQCIPGGGMNPCSWDTDRDGLPDAWEAYYAGEVSIGTNGVATVVGGMDATVPDSYTRQGLSEADTINRDYDNDGLENWQEYLVGAIRAFRYDDTLSPFRTDFAEMPESTTEIYNECFIEGEQLRKFSPLDEIKGPNPGLFYGSHDYLAAYFSVCRNTWDLSYGQYYMFHDGVNHCLDTGIYGGAENSGMNAYQKRIADDFGDEVAMGIPQIGLTRYIGTDPRNHDTDSDGMDDYWELFHGLNPMLGGDDIVAKAWGKEASFNATMNYWTYDPAMLVELGALDAVPTSGTGTGASEVMDFRVFPWMNGLPNADPDGDDIRNIDEAIMPNVQANATWLHTDPSPLWMTDPSYDLSIVSRSYKMPTIIGQGDIFIKGFFEDAEIEVDGEIQKFQLPYSYSTSRWSLVTPYNYEFEINEGFDSDRDGVNDMDESLSNGTPASDAQDADDPRRRQALYLPGDKSGAATPSNPSFGLNGEAFFLEFTVELWARPEDISRDQTLIERTLVVRNAQGYDSKFVRRNFSLNIEDGYWTAAFDHNGTSDIEIKARSAMPVEANKWVHLAATYDGTALVLYVNGTISGRRATSVHPATDFSDVLPEYKLDPLTQLPTDIEIYQGSWTSKTMLFIGAHAAGAYDSGLGWYFPTTFEDVTTDTGTYTPFDGFYKGWIDEVRVWDGARSESDIANNYEVRFTVDDVLENRAQIFDQLQNDATRDIGKSSTIKLAPELCYHYTFDDLFAAVDASEVAKVPAGFNAERALNARPEGWVSPAWDSLEYKSTVYDQYSYIPWFVNTKAHLPKFDGSTLDSYYWSHDFGGQWHSSLVGREYFAFPQTHELYATWQPMVYTSEMAYQSSRTTKYAQFDKTHGSQLLKLLEFAEGRETALWDTDMRPLGGAYVKVCEDFWDGEGPSTVWEATGEDSNGNGLPDWWEEKYGLDDDSTWDTIVNRQGTDMTAGDAYTRDIAAGAHETAPNGDSKYAQTADADHDGLPDWWERLYGITDETGADDSDNDGLSNYAEYMLSEVFNLGKVYDPTNPKSVDPYNLDYFTKVGQLYAGEIFTDHDMIEDDWESKYNPAYTSIFDYNGGYLNRFGEDACGCAEIVLDDFDEDGWSVFSEARYSQMSQSIVASEVSHYDGDGQYTADYPIPTLRMKVRYNGKNAALVNSADIIVQATTDKDLLSSPDATWKLTSESTSISNGHVRALGRWSNRHVVGTLSPGNISAESIRLQSTYDPDATIYTWFLQTDDVVIRRGTLAEYQEDARKYPGGVQLQTTDKGYEDITEVELRVDPQTRIATIAHSGGRDIIGTVNLISGEFDIDLTVFKGQYIAEVGDTNGLTVASLEDQSYRLVYATNPQSGLPRTVYLGEATQGHIRQGKNYFTVWADTINANGEYDVGEPLGFIAGEDIDWYGRELEVELTDTHPVFARLDLTTGATDRNYFYGTESGITSNDVLTAFSGGLYERVRVVRTAINGYSTNPEDLNIFNRVVFDKWIDLSVRKYLFEGDFLTDGEYDIDWNYFGDEVLGSPMLMYYNIDPIQVRYRIVLGNGTVQPQTTNNVISVNFERTFDLQESRAVAQPANIGIVTTASPTLEWSMNGYNSYSAFRVYVYDDKKVKIYDSGVKVAPPRINNSEFQYPHYSFTPPLYAGCMSPTSNHVFENGKRYYWQVQMYNSKFTSDASGVSYGQFYLDVPTSRGAVGKANVSVRYFGPSATFSGKRVYVQAFTSPDFSGRPVAAGHVANVNDIATANQSNDEPNSTVIGLPAGTYYFRAFIDSNNNGICDNWESYGYLCGRGTATTSPFNPVGVRYSPDNLGESKTFTIYIEDRDTDRDGLPDAWEFVRYGSLASRGVEQLNEELDCNIALNSTLSGNLKQLEVGNTPMSAMAGRILSSLARTDMVLLTLDEDIADHIALAAALNEPPTITDGSVSITAMTFDRENMEATLTVTAGVKPAVGATSRIYNFGTADTLSVTCVVYHKASLADKNWTPIARRTITLGRESAVVTVPFEGIDSSAAGFFQIGLEQ